MLLFFSLPKLKPWIPRIISTTTCFSRRMDGVMKRSIPYRYLPFALSFIITLIFSYLISPTDSILLYHALEPHSHSFSHPTTAITCLQLLHEVTCAQGNRSSLIRSMLPSTYSPLTCLTLPNPRIPPKIPGARLNMTLTRTGRLRVHPHLA